MVYLLDDNPRDQSNLVIHEVTPAKLSSLAPNAKASGFKSISLGSFPLSLLIAVVNGFLESKKLPIRLITVGDGA